MVGYGMLQAPNFGINGNKNSKYKCKNEVYKNGYRRRSCTFKTAKIHRFVIFVMYYIITTCSVECYWHCSDGTVHYKSDKTVNFCSFRCATTSPITVFINVVFTFIVKDILKCKKLELLFINGNVGTGLLFGHVVIFIISYYLGYYLTFCLMAFILLFFH